MSAPRPVATVERQAARLRLRCWGDFALWDAISGADVKPRGRKARALLAYLALHPGKPVSRERLTGLLWGDRGEEQARASLRQAIFELKPISGEDNKVLLVERDNLTLLPSALTTDIDEMREAVAAGDYDTFLNLLPETDESLLANLDGVDEAFADWLTIERSRQKDALVTLIADASAAALAEGQTRHARTLHARRREFDPAVALMAEPAPRAEPETAPKAEAPVTQPASLKRLGRRALIAAAAVLLLALIAGGIWYYSRPVPQATIAVLPFKSLPERNASFADGLSDEITAQLARQPGLHVAGRTSAAQFRDGNASLADIGRRLHVTYVLEGTVRSVNGQVRVNVALTKSDDGMQLWAETFDGSLNDVLAIQYRIGAKVAHALNLKLAHTDPPSGTLATTGQVYSLYLSARGLIRERTDPAIEEAHRKLLQAVTLDPNFAPAWSSLAQTENPGGLGADVRRRVALAIQHAKKALALAPDLPEAHGVLGMLYGFESPLGRQHVERAAALDPNNAEFQFWLGNTRFAHADYAGMLQAYRKAYALDPLWSYAQQSATVSAWQFGYRDEALSYLRAVRTDGSAYQFHMLRAALAEAQGDLSRQAAEESAASRATQDPGRRDYALFDYAAILERLGFYQEAYKARLSCKSQVPLPPGSDPQVLLRQGKLPSIAEVRARNANIPASWQDWGYVGRAVKLLVNAGMSRQVLSLYDGGGVLLISNGALPAPPARHIEDGPTIAAALRAVGRNAEAERMLASLDSDIAATLRKNGGRVPPRFLALAAQTWAMRGKQDAALSGLERALAGGWIYVVPYDDSSLADIGDEPAFRSLRGLPRFESVRQRLNTRIEQERREVRAELTA